MAGSTQAHLVSLTLTIVSLTVRSDSVVIFHKYLALYQKYLAIPQIFGGPCRIMWDFIILEPGNERKC